MKILKYIIAIIFLGHFTFVSAQSPGLLKAEGEIPKEFITPSATKYKKQVKDLETKKTKRKEKKEKSQFLLETNFAIDDILQSGMVLFNDPATVYVNKVLNNLPIDEDRKLTKKKPRAYVLNSSAVNAFATHQGIIFVTVGLLANLQNEAQLAFILSHELMHIKHQHAMNKFIKSKDIDKENKQNSKNLDQMALDRQFFKKSMYSRKLEEEADEDGLEIFLKSEYDPQAILNTFTVLHYSYLPFEDYEFEKSFFEDENFILPGNLWLDQLNAISPMENDKEEEKASSHPNSINRLKKMKSKIAEIDNTGKKVFILPEEEFRNIQNRARYQIPFLNLYDENFPEAIYTSYLMLQEFPDDYELKKVIAKSLYVEAKYKFYERHEGGSRNEELSKLANIVEGEVQQLYHLISKMDSREIVVIATKYMWKIYQENPKEEEINLLIKDMFVEFADTFNDLDDFSTTPKITEPKTSPPPSSDSDTSLIESNNNMSKYDKIKKGQEEGVFWKYAFVNELKDTSFNAYFERGHAYLEKVKERETYYDNLSYKERKKLRKKNEKKGKRLGIDKIVLVNPFYLSLDERKGGIVQFFRSEKKQSEFRKAIKELAEKSDLDAVVLDVTDLSRKDVDKFNDIAEINQYFGQQMNHYNFSLTPGYNQKAVNEIAEKYNTDYFLWTGVISLHEKNRGAWGAVAATLIMPPLLPFSIANAVTPKYDMLYYAILYDVKTGRRSIIKMDFYDKRDNNTILNAHIYDVFHQIKSKRK